MKKGFTLAEVLITMAIIGVIAAVTLPALNVNVAERSAITKYKKAMSTLNNIGTIVAANDGFNYSDLATGAIGEDTRGNVNGQLRREVWAVFDRYGKIDRRMTASGRNPGGDCTVATGGIIYFKDGSAFCYDSVTVGNNGNLDTITGTIDINGIKEPNAISSCSDANCNNRSIFDQFSVTLAGEEAYPGTASVDAATLLPTYDRDEQVSNAAIWAMEQ